MGGYSREFEISLKSGNVVYNTLKNIYNCYRIHILKDEWFLLNNANEKLSINRETFKTEIGPQIEFDCIFNAIHGSPGENGIMQNYFTKLGIPITGCSSKQSKLTFDKIKCLEFLKNRGIKTADSIVIKKNTKFVMSKVEETIGFPCFVKASKSGSSFGVYKVYNEKEFVNCLNSP